MMCEACGGEVMPLGALGGTLHGRCRSCGLNQEIAAEDSLFGDDEDEDLEDEDIDEETS